ncbi:MAG: alpha-glucan family phosphorylase [Patescibacteria group bacterium]
MKKINKKIIKKKWAAVAYISMEIALENEIKNYAGGLGVLAGDILRSAADLSFPMVGVTLLNDRGYFKQVISSDGEQIKRTDSLDFSKLKKLPAQVVVNIGKEKVKVGVWRYRLRSGGGVTPIYLLDTNIPGNSRANRELTGELYGGNNEYRLKQEIILGRGAIKILKALDYEIEKFHINEGHGALAAIELFLDQSGGSDEARLEAVRQQCVFTTHTPLAKGQDIFSLPYLKRYQADWPASLKGLMDKGEINMTRVALYFCAYSNAVSKKHGVVSRRLFPGFKIRTVTNGVNSVFWSAPEFKKLYDKYLPDWRKDNGLLTRALKIPSQEIWTAHQKAKSRLIRQLNKEKRAGFKKEVFTICYARRFTPYKRPEFLLNDLDRLVELQRRSGKIQLIFAGKAHPQDLDGQELIKQVHAVGKKLFGKIKIVFWENYDLKKAANLASGSDLWLNTPLPPNEASGTSGMKAAHNGVPQASTLDGWWPEGYVKGKTGWVIKENNPKDLYNLLEKEILPLYYKKPAKWTDLMVSVIALNASFFNTERVLRQYIKEAYKLKS